MFVYTSLDIFDDLHDLQSQHFPLHQSALASFKINMEIWLQAGSSAFLLPTW